MPSNQINPFNYDIDKFDSGFLGPITDGDLRTYLYTHNLPVINPVIGGILGGSAWDERGSEYNVSMSIPKVVDVPSLSEVANTPSLYNNMSKPREVNLESNIQTVNPSIQEAGYTNYDLGRDVTTLFNPTTSNIDLPSVDEVATTSSPLNNFTDPTEVNLSRNPTLVELSNWHPDYGYIFTSESASYRTPYGVPVTLRLGFAGSVESWVSEGGYVSTVHEIRDLLMFAPENNKYGPAQIRAYNDPDTTPIDTGFIQYNDVIQGDIRDQLFSRTLGVGVVPFSEIGSGINYKPDGIHVSELDTIAKKRRGVELANRIKLNFTDDTIGAINTSPFGLLAGGSLINRDYTITVPKTKVGKVAEFTARLAGFSLPVSILPPDAFPQSPGQSVDIPDALLDYTGSGQKGLLFDALYINKFGPTLGNAYSTPTTGQVKKSLAGAGQPPNTKNYLSEPTQPPTTPRDKSLIDTLNDKVDSLFTAQQAPSIPTEGDSPTVSDVQGGFYGKFEPYNAVGRSFSEKNGFGNEDGLYEVTDFDKPSTRYNGTPVEQSTSTDQTGTIDERIDWRTRDTNPYKKGILKYTQALINKSKLGDAAGYIGYFDSAEALKTTSYKQDINKHGHITGAKSPTSAPTRESKGNTARNYEFGTPASVTADGTVIPATPDTGGEFYCRSWSSRRKYHTWDNLIRSEANWWRVEKDWANLMTMDTLGKPKIAWDSGDSTRLNSLASFINDAVNGGNGVGYQGMLVPYMFSIENLAWIDAPQMTQLPPCEIGPNGGRIMWFPPYDINFSDSVSANWDSTNFIGRGEPIYTYNHTERTGQLSFTIVVDHPSALNELRSRFTDTLTDEGYNSFFAGCNGETIKELFKNYVPSNTSFAPPEVEPPIQRVTPTPTDVPSQFSDIKIYFENCRNNETNPTNYSSPNGIGRAVDITNYEVIYSSIAGPEASTLVCVPGTGLNQGLTQKLNDLAAFLVKEEGKNFKIVIEGNTSAANPTSGFNTKLATDRANNTKEYLFNLMVAAEGGVPPKLTGTEKEYPLDFNLKQSTDRWETKQNGKETAALKCLPSNSTNGDCNDGNPCSGSLEDGQANSKTAKLERFASITLVSNTILQTNLINQTNNDAKASFDLQQKDAQQKADAAKLAAKFYINECDYFMEMKRTDPFIYNSLGEKIKNFHPAFHAITPEGFNSRITFLQQCMRQGPQLIDPNAPQNMVFGRPPICVLKIGDFYHTKIVIDNCNFTFDPLQWDLNPEGIGVQPMIVKVDLSFKFIGGSSLGGPIKQLQNAVSYNFFANTGVYRPASVLGKAMSDRQAFIYGAFITPTEADSKYQQVQDLNTTKTEAAKQASENKTPATNPDTVEAPIDGGTLAEIEIFANKEGI